MFRHLYISCAHFSYLKLEGLVVGTSKYLFAWFSFWGMRGVQPVVPVIWRYFVNKLPSSLLNLRTSSLSSWNKSSTDSMNSNILNNTRTNIKHRKVLVYDRFAGLGIRSFPLSLFALSLKIALFKEQLWAIRSLQKSDASKLVSLLFKKEWRKWFACNLRFRSQKTSDLLDKIRIFDSFHSSLHPSFPRGNRYFALSLTKNERRARKNKKRIPNPADLAISVTCR